MASVLACLAFAACGGERGGQDFAAEASAICAGSANAQTLVATGVPTTAAEAIANDRRLIEIRRDVLERLAGVDAPEGVSREYLRFVATRGAVLTTVEERLASRQAGDQADLARTVAKQNGAYEVSDAAAAALGIDVCAGILPAADRAEVEALTEEIFTADDPEELERICAELVTPAFIEVGGGAEQCLRADEPAPESLAVEDVRGVAGVNAQARFVPRGGTADGVELVATYVYRDGAYRLNSLSRAAPRAARP